MRRFFQLLNCYYFYILLYTPTFKIKCYSKQLSYKLKKKMLVYMFK